MDYYPIYEPNKWNKNFYILKSHNCYAYALNLIYNDYIDICKKYSHYKNEDEYCSNVRSQPGMYSNIIKITHNINIEKRMLKDNPYIKKTTYNSEIPQGYYKIALFIDKNNKYQYHFYREDKNKLWSHKDGWGKATNKDSNNKIIKNPEKCKKNPMYNTLLGYYLVPINPLLKNMANMHTIKPM